MGGDERPEVLPSLVDPAYECVRQDDADERAAPPDPGSPGSAPPVCPPGYLPRLRSRAPYDLDGKDVVTDEPPEENPRPPR